LAQDDLIPFSERSKDEAKELGQKGGIASGAVRRKKAAMKDYVQFILGMKRKVSEKTLEQLKEMGVTEDEVTGQTLALMKIMDKAIAGDIKAMEFLRDTAGEKPTDSTNIAHSFDGDVVVSMKRNDKA
jgi:hypothetical protein